MVKVLSKIALFETGHNKNLQTDKCMRLMPITALQQPFIVTIIFDYCRFFHTVVMNSIPFFEDNEWIFRLNWYQTNSLMPMLFSNKNNFVLFYSFK